ncbi:MAG: hypothetical protein R3E82_16110 [Pseudomonadales bacterium]|nr:hypothetical protein [Pseudomonadales bacterium]
MRTLICGGSAFDRLLFDNDQSALDESALHGLALFTSPRLRCTECHAGFNLSGPIHHAVGGAAASFHHTGVSESGEAYRAPTLRFLRFTPPHMHDGSQATLETVLAFYERGGGPGPSELTPFVLTDAERRDLIAFLNQL